jgi:iron complex transport system substrate-binding protein
MAAGSTRLSILRLAAWGLGAWVAATAAAADSTAVAPSQRSPAGQRIVSLVPAVTEMLFVIGAGKQVIAVSSYDDFGPEVAALPRVGALLDPDVERILALRPDLVITYGSQSDLETQLARAGIRTFSYRHAGIAGVMRALRELGAAVGYQREADRTVRGIQEQLDAIAARVRGRPRPTVLLAFGRQPQSLQQLYASGGVGFLHEMLEIAGGVNVFADVRREAVQPSHETLLARAPAVILDIRATVPVRPEEEERERNVWRALASIPAVRNGRIHFLNGDYLVVPGPRLGLATEVLARALHPEAFK